jgi:hypothetical protein
MQKVIRRFTILGVLSAAVMVSASLLHGASAQSGEFALQISPSPLVATLKPNQATTLELKIRNAGTQTEELKIAPRTFKIMANQQLELDDTKQPDVASWLHFSSLTFTIKPGEVFTQKVTLNVPKDASFSYSFALVISRQQNPLPEAGGTALKGSVALFTLINIDRPGASRSLGVSKFRTSKDIYEYLPAEFDIDFKNTGNTIVQPAGSIFVQRSSDDKTPLTSLAVNTNNGYILPSTTRTLKVNWDDGFQVQRSSTNADGSTSSHVEWNWGKLGNIRIGRYTAKLVAIYNDGQRDIPVYSEISFWVIPWKILLGLFIAALLVGVGVWSLVSKIIRLGKRFKH